MDTLYKQHSAENLRLIDYCLHDMPQHQPLLAAMCIPVKGSLLFTVSVLACQQIHHWLG